MPHQRPGCSRGAALLQRCGSRRCPTPRAAMPTSRRWGRHPRGAPTATPSSAQRPERGRRSSGKGTEGKALGCSLPRFPQSRDCGSQRAAGYTTAPHRCGANGRPSQHDPPQHDGFSPSSAEPGGERRDNAARGGGINNRQHSIKKTAVRAHPRKRPRKEMRPRGHTARGGLRAARVPKPKPQPTPTQPRRHHLPGGRRPARQPPWWPGPPRRSERGAARLAAALLHTAAEGRRGAGGGGCPRRREPMAGPGRGPAARRAPTCLRRRRLRAGRGRRTWGGAEGRRRQCDVTAARERTRAPPRVRERTAARTAVVPSVRRTGNLQKQR